MLFAAFFSGRQKYIECKVQSSKNFTSFFPVAVIDKPIISFLGNFSMPTMQKLKKKKKDEQHRKNHA